MVHVNEDARLVFFPHEYQNFWGTKLGDIVEFFDPDENGLFVIDMDVILPNMSENDIAAIEVFLSSQEIDLNLVDIYRHLELAFALSSLENEDSYFPMCMGFLAQHPEEQNLELFQGLPEDVKEEIFQFYFELYPFEDLVFNDLEEQEEATHLAETGSVEC